MDIKKRAQVFWEASTGIIILSYIILSYSIGNYYLFRDHQQQVTPNLTIDDVLNYQRQQITEEMQYYEFTNGRFGVDAKNLQELTLETGGNPMRSVIVSTWRSGSTFLGDVLNSLPGNYYHYEPLLTYDIMQIRGPPYDKPAIKTLKKLLSCNYRLMKFIIFTVAFLL